MSAIFNNEAMKTKMSLLITALLLTLAVQAQTIAVSDLSTRGIKTTPTTTGKLTRLELVKIDQYTVLDEFDMVETLERNPDLKECYGKKCLIRLGQALNVDYVLSGSVDGIGNKIVINLKLVDIKSKTLKTTHTKEFERQELELQRMIGMVIQEMHDITPDPTTMKSLQYRNDIITPNNVGKINNTGPRMGISYVVPTGKEGDQHNFFTREEEQGGLDQLPIMSHIGFQFEYQYIGTDNFSALGEMILNVSGMEQGQFLPNVTLMNGFRIGKQGWEFAFGPNFGARRVSEGIFIDDDNGKHYYRKSEYETKLAHEWASNPDNLDPVTGEVINPFFMPSVEYDSYLDKRGRTEFSTSWVMAFGRTFRYGSLNMPVNVYYSSNKFGGTVGASLGFNIVTKKRKINR